MLQFVFNNSLLT